MSELNNIKNEFEDIEKEVDKELNDEPILNDVINTILTMTQDEEKESSRKDAILKILENDKKLDAFIEKKDNWNENFESSRISRSSR